ncbi:LysR family transcriptional regulator [Paludibacterium yongneupense]|uniref:LysR family transcriptional regulator n=1 Tax=Paludibacterium yongneupense TaxID=400061 RepID=UPI00040A788C|nr:LysR family transcriptional regulator [Paludibacterium yongneupense]
MRPCSLSDLDAFASVARKRSFRQAALERGVSPSLLSQTIQRLEQQLGVRLLNRTTRSVTPTQAGEMMLAGLEPAFSGIAQTLEQLNALRDRPSGRLRINAPLPVVHLLLAPRVADFMRRHPDIELEISGDDNLIDVLGQGFDAGVRYGEDLAQDMVAIPLQSPPRRVVVAAPDFLARVGTPLTPHDLLGHSLIAHRFARGDVYRWEFMKDGQPLTITPGGPLTANEPWLEVRAALDGVGFAWVFEDYVAARIASGDLVTVLDDWCAPMPAPYLYYSSRKYISAPLRAFIDYMREARAGG